MKKQLILPLLAVLVFMMSGCKKEYITQTIQNTTVLTTVKPSDWSFQSSDGTYTVGINMPEITDVVNDNDGVLVDCMFDGINYEPLPQVYNGYSYTYFYRTGVLYLSVQGADGSNGVRPTANVGVKIVLIPSGQ